MSIMNKHGLLERHSLLLTIGILVVVSIGGLIQMAPLAYMDNTIEKVDGMRPYTPLDRLQIGIQQHNRLRITSRLKVRNGLGDFHTVRMTPDTFRICSHAWQSRNGGHQDHVNDGPGNRHVPDIQPPARQRIVQFLDTIPGMAGRLDT